MEQVNELAQTIKTRFDFEAAKRILREKYEAKMLFASQGGMWRAGPQLLSLLKSIDSGLMDSVVLEDEYGNPVKVQTLALKVDVEQRWQEQMNAWHQEFESIQKER